LLLPVRDTQTGQMLMAGDRLHRDRSLFCKLHAADVPAFGRVGRQALADALAAAP